MKILMLSTDQNVFQEGSAVRQRMADYGSLVEELHIIVFTKFQIRNLKIQILKNVCVYPTNSRFKLFYFLDAYKIAGKVIKSLSHKANQWLITTQDPFETGLVGYLLKKKFKIPLQVQIHTDFLSPYFWRESLKNKLRVWLAKWLVKKADCIRVVSERIKNSLMSNVKSQMSKVEVLPIFVDIPKLQAAPVKTDLHKKYPNYDFIILMASRLAKEKNIGLAIAAFANIQDSISTIKNPLLLIVGDGPERRSLQLKTYNLQVENNVKFEPWTDDLASYYKTADLFLITSNYEGYSLAAMEAAAAGLPVIMTDVGIALGEVVPVGDLRALTAAIKKAIENPRFRADIIARQTKFLENLPVKTKAEFLGKINESWLNCYSLPKK